MTRVLRAVLCQTCVVDNNYSRCSYFFVIATGTFFILVIDRLTKGIQSFARCNINRNIQR